MSYTQATGNEFWYAFDFRTKYTPAFGPTLMAAKAFDVQDIWHAARKTGSYPADVVAFVNQAKAAWEAIAEVQVRTITEFFQADRTALRLAFEDFGQGIMLDNREPRKSNNDCIHMMDTGGAPPIGYHRWHASIRAIQTFDADPLWSDLAQFNGLAWAIQSHGRPKQSKVKANPQIDAHSLTAIRSAWLALSQDQLDKQYDLGTGTSGYHPSPSSPVI